MDDYIPREQEDKSEQEASNVAPQESRSGQKWWESKLILTFIALVVPLLGLLFNYTKYLSEEAQAQRRQDNEIQMQYLTLATRTDAGLQQQKMILRFLAAIASEKKVRDWASQEITATASVEEQKAKDTQKLEAEFQSLLSEIRKISTGTTATHDTSIQVNKLLRLAEINRNEIDRLRKQIDNPAAPGLPQSSKDRFHCLAGTVTAQGSAGSGETRVAQCQSSIAPDGTPPNGVLELSGLSYSWMSNGTPCSCTVSASVD